MKFTVKKNELPESVLNFMRRAGYSYFRDPRTRQESYIRRLTRNFYPRLHCYVFDQGGMITFNIHLDQRLTRYEGQTAHAGEYESPIVREEMERLQAVFEKYRVNPDTNESFADIVGGDGKKKKWWPFS